MPIVEIDRLDRPELDVFRKLTEAQLRQAGETGTGGLFIAESPKVIRTALQCGIRPWALLCSRKHIAGDAADIVAACPDLPVYTGDDTLLSRLTGYPLTRGVLMAMQRPALPAVEAICRKARRIVIIHGVVEATNVGAIFRSVAALGFDGIILSPDSCDPLNRRSVRVSMGTVFQVPWTWDDCPLESLRNLGFRTAALALTPDAISLDAPELKREERLAIVMGTEGDGLPRQTIAAADYVVRIPMAHGVDSLNVAAATAVACWELRVRE